MIQRASAHLPEIKREVKLVFFSARTMRSETVFVENNVYVCIDLRQIQMIASF